MVAALVLAVWVWLQWRQPLDEVAAPPASAAVQLPEQPRIILDDSPPIDAFSEMVERPLFVPSRRPSQLPGEQQGSAPIAVAEGVDGMSGYTLSGISIVGDSKRALLRGSEYDEFVKLGIGDSVGDWQLDAIEESAVRLSNAAGEQLELQLRRFDGVADYPQQALDEEAPDVRELLGPDGELVADPDDDESE